MTAVTLSTRRNCFIMELRDRTYEFPFSRCDPPPNPDNPVKRFYIDPEIANEGITYVLESGAEGCLHMDQVLDFNEDPDYMRDILLFNLTLEAQERLKTCGLSKRAVIRRLGTSAAQFYRLIDQTNYTKSVDQMLRLLSVLNCHVSFEVTQKSA